VLPKGPPGDSSRRRGSSRAGVGVHLPAQAASLAETAAIRTASTRADVRRALPLDLHPGDSRSNVIAREDGMMSLDLELLEASFDSLLRRATS
jgi:hypothetical protein